MGSLARAGSRNKRLMGLYEDRKPCMAVVRLSRADEIFLTSYGRSNDKQIARYLKDRKGKGRG